METASRTRNALGKRIFETTWTTRDNFFKGSGRTIPPAPWFFRLFAEAEEGASGGKKCWAFLSFCFLPQT